MTKKSSKIPDSERTDTTENWEGTMPELIDLMLASPNVWPQPPANVQPRKSVSPWTVYRATPKNGQPNDMYGLHFVGRDLSEWSGCVSSRVVSFDPKTMSGTTISGRVYELVSQPGHCSDGDYVLGHWADFNEVEVEDVTEQFMKTYGLTIQRIMEADQQKFIDAKNRR